MQKLAEYVNPNAHPVQLKGPDNRYISVQPKSKIILPDFYNKYTPKQLKFVRYITRSITRNTNTRKSVRRSGEIPPTISKPKQTYKQNREMQRNRNSIRSRTKDKISNTRANYAQRPIGRRDPAGIVQYTTIASNTIVPISNNIGVGILSYNRFDSLKNLVESIKKYTNLKRTTVFISDESTNLTTDQINWLKEQTDIIPLIAQPHIGVAGNTNRLLRCLERFKYKLILNDDVEILNSGWELFYINAINHTGIHHFCYREPGIYGAKEADEVETIAGPLKIRTIKEKPHGAVMFFDSAVFDAIGYFNEEFGMYGMEHVDWSTRAAKVTNKPGYHDIAGSENYFKINKVTSALENRSKHFTEAKAKYSSLSTAIRVNPTAKSIVPSMSIIVPFRDSGRLESVEVVIHNLKAQRYPCLEIILAEQDAKRHINLNKVSPIKYVHVPNQGTGHFNKSRAFNTGYKLASHNKIILHDADILVPGRYSSIISDVLDTNDGCHLGHEVYYLDEKSTSDIYRSCELLPNYTCNRLVNYFEGGSLGCTKQGYIKAGGFREEYEGYGVEDCCFYERLKELTKFLENRVVKFFHLQHGRVSGWEARHAINKDLYATGKQTSGTLDKYADHIRSMNSKYFS